MSCYTLKGANQGRLIMQPKYGWNAIASGKLVWFEKSTLARPKSIAPLMVASASDPFLLGLPHIGAEGPLET